MSEVTGIGSLPRAIYAGSAAGPEVERPKQDFYSYVTQALEKVNQSQHEADRLTTELVSGESTDLHQVMLAAEKANLGLQLTIQVRNKVIEAYQEIMRMQM